MKPLLIKHKKLTYVVLIDKEDWKRVKKHSWHIHFSRGTKKKVGQPYARANIGRNKVYLHRFVTGAELPLHVDHKNWQTLDCRRKENLEVISHEENQKRRRKLKAKPLCKKTLVLQFPVPEKEERTTFMQHMAQG